jgi:hypothetical protein
VAVTHLPHLQTVSGLFHFRIFGDLPLVVQVSASSHPSVPVVRDDLLETAREEPHVYPSPQKDERYDYTVGGHWTFVQIGQKAITGRRPNRKLFGNYGVLYNITVEMKNPTPAERVVRVMFQPGANWARGAFRIEGKLIEAPQLAPPQEAELWSARLGPGQTRSLSIQGIPAGGSAYPVSLVVRS